MDEIKRILIVGVGGQGTLLASRILGAAMLQCGYDVKVSEVHGMSQRGGSVVTYVKYGMKIDSPMIEAGEADIILAFEELEASRYLSYLKPGGVIIVNSQQIAPMPVITGAAEYPQGIIDKIKADGVKIYEVDALGLAKEAGSLKAVNVVLIGAMARLANSGDEAIWLNAIAECVPPKMVELNQAAFQLGSKSVAQ